MARIIKKYGNRRLYDTEQSGYVTLAELEQIVREGADIRVVDAKSGADLTQSTLVQIILDSRRAAELLPVPLLVRLVRLGDDALAEFFGQYVGAALQMYLQAKQGFQMVNPLAAMANPMDAFGALGRVWNGWGEAPAPTPEPSHAAARNRRAQGPDAGRANIGPQSPKEAICAPQESQAQLRKIVHRTKNH